MRTEYMVDSNVYIDLLRLNRDPLPLLEDWAGIENLVICGMVRLEVLRGVTEKKAYDRMSSFMDLMINVRSDNNFWIESSALAWKLDRQGKVIPGTDVIIATSALRIGATILTSDAHFRHIEGLEVIHPPEEWFS